LRKGRVKTYEPLVPDILAIRFKLVGDVNVVEFQRRLNRVVPTGVEPTICIPDFQ